MREKEYTCWYQGQTEEDGKILKAPNAEAAAKKAVDIWRHEQFVELGSDSVKVSVRDFSGDKTFQIEVRGTAGENHASG